jgi:hypothetical protein
MNGSYSQWSIPSTHLVGHYYTATVYHDASATQCDCPWGSKEEAHTRCWHAKFALAMENDEVKAQVGELTWRRAHSGDLYAQVAMLSSLVALLVDRDALVTASRVFEVLNKYLVALSVQGATFSEEAATQAASSVEPCGQCMGRGTVLTLDGEGLINDDFRETCPICQGSGRRAVALAS